jgi:hypothetical protein
MLPRARDRRTPTTTTPDWVFSRMEEIRGPRLPPGLAHRGFQVATEMLTLEPPNQLNANSVGFDYLSRVVRL